MLLAVILANILLLNAVQCQIQLCSEIIIGADPCFIAGLKPEKARQAHDKGYAVTCICAELKTIPTTFPLLHNQSLTPPTRVLNLGFNQLTRLDNYAFLNKTNLNTSDLMWLFLDNNQIYFIDTYAFSELRSLVYLNLSLNFLTWPGSYANELFRPLVNLDTLNLNGNTFQNFSGLGKELSVLNSSLTQLFLDANESCRFGKGFELLTKLSNVSLSSPASKKCNLKQITNKTFAYIPQVKMLWIRSCHINHIDTEAFAKFVNLELLDLSYNEDLHFEGMNMALAGLRNSSLKILNVNHIYSFLEAGITLQPEQLKNLKTLTKLETLHMDLNKIEVMNWTVLDQDYFPPTLKDLTLSGNRLTAGVYLNYLSCLKNVAFIDISRQHLNYDPYFWQHYTPGVANAQLTKDNCSIKLPPSTHTLLWSRSFLYMDFQEVNICHASNLKHLDLSFNLIYSWKGPVTGVENVKYMDLSDNTCNYVTPYFFDGFPSLTFLNISNNNLGSVFSSVNETAAVVLKSLLRLEILDMSYNRITSLHDKTFFNMTNLEGLNISDNMLSEWSVDLSTSRCLNYINLSGNKIKTLSPTTRDYLDSLTSEKCNEGKNVTVDLSQNSVMCTCDDLPFLKWVNITKVIVEMRKTDECRVNGKQIVIETEAEFHELLNVLVANCADRTWITYTIAGGSTIVGVCITCLVFFFVYKYRWKLRYIYYSRHKRFRHSGFEHLFANDAMISYAKSKALFVKDSLLPALEEKGLTLWVADKHARAGVSIAENIVHAIYTSKKTVLLVDQEYTKDSWCDYEMNMALVESIESKRKLIIVVLLENINMERLPISILRFLRSERSLEYPEDIQNLETFWTNLADEIER